MWFQNPRHPKGQTQHSTRHYSLIPPKAPGPAVKQPHTKRLCVISFGSIKIDRLSVFMKYFLKAHIPLTWGLLFRFDLLHMHQSQGGHFHIRRPGRLGQEFQRQILGPSTLNLPLQKHPPGASVKRNWYCVAIIS